MAFNPSDPKYQPKGIKKLPVVLLLDVSGSMQGRKIVDLHDAVAEMVNSYVELKRRERVIEVAIITFGAEVKLYSDYKPVEDLQRDGIPQFTANGGTPLGRALRMAKDLMEDDTASPHGNYRPAVVLVSDGEPNDEWRGPMQDFISEGRTEKAQRFSVAIGADADQEMLREFAQSDDAMFFSENAKSLAEAFRTISTRSANAAKAAKPDDAAKKTDPMAQGGSPAGADPADSDDPWMMG